MKKILALVLALVMLGSLIVGCAPQEDPKDDPVQTTTGSGSDETTTSAPELAVDHFKGTKLKVAVLKKDADTVADYNNKAIIKMVTEATGIETEWIVIDPSVVNDRLATMLMSDDQPDIYLGFFATNETMFTNNLEAFYDLSEEGLLDTYAPNVVRDYDKQPMMWTASIQGDGSIRGLVTGGTVTVDPMACATSFYAINQEWLDKAQMEVPTNADELYAVLKYFKENDMDGDGDPNNEIPMSFANGYWETDLMMLAAPFGIAGNYTWQAQDHYKNIKDGKVVSTVDTENYRAFLEFFHKLYSEGLLDVEGFSQTADQYKAKRDAKICGVIHTYSTMLDQGYTPFLWQGMEGVTPMISGMIGRFTGQRGNFAISAKSENVEAALWWWNWMSKDAETKQIASGGSDHFIVGDDGKFYPNPDYEGVTSIDGLGNYSPVVLPDEGLVQSYEAYNEPNKARYDFLIGIEYLEHMNLEAFPVMYADAEAAEERGFIETELYPYIATFTANAIRDGIDDAKWQKHLDDLESYQYSDWLGMWQDMVDEAARRLEG